MSGNCMYQRYGGDAELLLARVANLTRSYCTTKSRNGAVPTVPVQTPPVPTVDRSSQKHASMFSGMSANTVLAPDGSIPGPSCRLPFELTAIVAAGWPGP